MGQAKLLLVSVLFLMRVETIRPMRDYLRGELTIYGDHTHGVPEGVGGWGVGRTIHGFYGIFEIQLELKTRTVTDIIHLCTVLRAMLIME